MIVIITTIIEEGHGDDGDVASACPSTAALRSLPSAYSSTAQLRSLPSAFSSTAQMRSLRSLRSGDASAYASAARLPTELHQVSFVRLEDDADEVPLGCPEASGGGFFLTELQPGAEAAFDDVEGCEAQMHEGQAFGVWGGVDGPGAVEDAAERPVWKAHTTAELVVLTRAGHAASAEAGAARSSSALAEFLRKWLPPEVTEDLIEKLLPHFVEEVPPGNYM